MKVKPHIFAHYYTLYKSIIHVIMLHFHYFIAGRIKQEPSQDSEISDISRKHWSNWNKILAFPPQQDPVKASVNQSSGHQTLWELIRQAGSSFHYSPVSPFHTIRLFTHSYSVTGQIQSQEKWDWGPLTNGCLLRHSSYNTTNQVNKKYIPLQASPVSNSAWSIWCRSICHP